MQPSFNPFPGPPPQVPLIAPVQKKVRWGLVILGIILGIVGILVIVGGAIASLASGTASSLDPVAEARSPGTATFTAEATTYDVSMVRERGESNSASGYRCTVTLADGRTLELDGSRQGTSSETPSVKSIGSFDAVAGPTSVFCENENGSTRFIVDDESAVDQALPYILGAGVVLLLLATGSILLGVFKKKTVAPAH
ncbi:MAG: hypothetical protein ABMA25_14720 [Ilumatobacteraceae bacterium]